MSITFVVFSFSRSLILAVGWSMSIDFKALNEYSFGCLQSLTEAVLIDVSKKRYTQDYFALSCI